MGTQSSVLSVVVLSSSIVTITDKMSDSFPEIKSKQSLVAKYVTEPLWEKLGKMETKTSQFTLSKAIACAVQFDNQHFCMNTPITYNTSIPHHGNHRPIWPKFGEYQFVPPQRWFHNIEHGAVVMLYHPCAHPTMVEQLRKLVTGCIRKHVITPYTNIPEDKPLALVAWGCRMLMSSVDEVQVTNFIREKGLHGPEGSYPKEGQYTQGLLKLAEVPTGSSNEDSVLCPNFI